MASKKIFFEKKIFLVSKKNFLPFQIEKKSSKMKKKKKKICYFNNFNNSNTLF